MGLQEKGPSSFNTSENGIDFGSALWKKFTHILSEGDLSLQQTMYGVSWPADEKTPPDLIHYFVGIEKHNKELPVDLVKLQVEGGEYFRYEYKGPLTSIDQGFQDAYMNALPRSGFVSRVGQHLEIYRKGFDPYSPVTSFEILIPVCKPQEDGGVT